MEQSSPQDKHLQHHKQEQLLKILALRQQCKKLRQAGKSLASQASLFSQISLLLTKYELLPNLCYYRDYYFFISQREHSVLFYDLKLKKFNTLKEQESKDLENSFLYQTNDQQLNFSFGKIREIHQAQVQIKKKQNPEMKTKDVFQMQTRRWNYKVAMNASQILFYIGGNGVNGANGAINDCETLNLRNKKQSLTSSIPCSVRGEGACFGGEDLYLTGGFKTKELQMSQVIQCYSPQRDS